MQVNRYIAQSIIEQLNSTNNKIIVIYGARQTGKTTLVKEIIDKTKYRTVYINGDDIEDIKNFSTRDTNKLSKLVKGYDLLFVDEAQRIKEIGLNLKILYDRCQPIKIIVTGSSSLELASTIKEPLTGRTIVYNLYPISYLELAQTFTYMELDRHLDESLMYGSYPEVLSLENSTEKQKYLKTLTESYLYKDILELGNIKYSKVIRDLLTLLAYQIGNEISHSEIGRNLGINNQTVASYIDLLEKCFVLKILRPFSRNLRKETTKKAKIYFYDLGIRNALIKNFDYPKLRNDLGPLWENFLFVERMKRNEYVNHIYDEYFWRTYSGAELDYVEKYDGNLYGYEFKWSKTRNAPKLWSKEYNGSYSCINRDNFLEFILA